MENAPPTILFVDDEVSILKALKRLFMEEDWNLLFSDNGEEGLKILEKEEVDLVVSDVRMPGMDGIAFFRQVKERHPSIVRVFLSGYADKMMVAQALAEGCAQQILPKPWVDSELKEVIRNALRQSRRQRRKGADLQTLINSLSTLPALPDTYTRLRECLADREIYSVDRVA